MHWFLAAFLALISFGFWGLFTKLSVLHIDPKSALIFQVIGVMIIGIFTLHAIHYKPMINLKGITYALLTGLAYGIGCWFYFIAASKEKIITVVTLTALYPLITILLAYLLLKEIVSIKQGIGIALALLAIILMST